MKTLLAIDQGTTSSRAILFADNGDIIATRQKELTLHYPHKGWVEQDPEDIWRDTLWACEGLIKDEEAAKHIAAIGITNQRETTIIWDRKTGIPVYNAIVWQDRRTAEYCAELKNADEGYEDIIRSKTGLLLDPYFSATKVKWILDNVEGVRKRAEAGELAFGTVDSFLLWRLTGGAVHATDATNASRTMLYNIVEQDWDQGLLSLFDIPASLLPSVHDNCHAYGVTKILDQEIMIGGMAGDQQAAMIGQACFAEGMVKSTYGTGCFALMNIGGTFKESKNKLLTTIAYQFDGQVTYAIEGSIFMAGATLQWLRDNLGFFDDVAESEALALSVEDSNEVYFVPAFTGLGAPYWDPHARAAITGLSRESTKAHITRAALEAQAFQTHDLLSAFVADSGYNFKTLRVDGGLVANKFVCQFLSDILNCIVEVPKVTETTALGAAYLAGIQSGVFSGLDDIKLSWGVAETYSPTMVRDEQEKRTHRWRNEIERVIFPTVK